MILSCFDAVVTRQTYVSCIFYIKKQIFLEFNISLSLLVFNAVWLRNLFFWDKTSCLLIQGCKYLGKSMLSKRQCTDLLSTWRYISEKRGFLSADFSALFIVFPSRRCLHFDVVAGLEWSKDPDSHAGGSVATGRASFAGQVKVMTQTKRDTLNLQGGGWA
jgi:hypothetical protein